LCVFPGITRRDWRTDPNYDVDSADGFKKSQLKLRYKHIERIVEDEDNIYAAIEIPNPEIIRFFSTWIKLYKMHEEDVLDDEVYCAWVEKRLKELSHKPLSFSWPEHTAAKTSDPTPDAKN